MTVDLVIYVPQASVFACMKQQWEFFVLLEVNVSGDVTTTKVIPVGGIGETRSVCVSTTQSKTGMTTHEYSLKWSRQFDAMSMRRIA